MSVEQDQYGDLVGNNEGMFHHELKSGEGGEVHIFYCYWRY